MDALNLYYAHGRWYNPDTGLFLSPDENGEYRYGSGQDAVNWVWFAWGFNCQFYSDITLGLYEYQHPFSLYKCQDFSGAEFYIGRWAGRAASDALAFLEIYAGGTTFVGGGGLALISGGTLTHVSAPAMVGGAALTSHGATVLLRNMLTPIAFVRKGAGDPIPAIQPPTDRSGLRKAMERAGIKPPPTMKNPQAHHNLPWKFKDWFAGKGRGLNVNDHQFGRWVEGTPPGQHQSWTFEYEQIWENWIRDNPNATREQVLEFLNQLLSSGRFP